MIFPVISRPPLELAFVACFLLSGCGDATIAKVTGKVTYNGQPVTEGKILFYPESGRMALGNINPDGTYSLTTFKPNDGALIGAHRVAIEATRVVYTSPQPQSLKEETEPAKNGKRSGRPPIARVEWMVPQKYSRPENSGLTATVGSTDNEIDFALPANK